MSGLDRDAVQRAIESGDDGAYSQRRDDDDRFLRYDGDIDLDAVLALLRPVGGVVLTREEAQHAAMTVRAWAPNAAESIALAERLEATS